MIKMTITSTGIPQIIAQLNNVTKGNLPILKKAVSMAAEHVAQVWRDVVIQSEEVEFDGSRFTVHRRTGNYDSSIRVQYPYENELSALITANAKYAKAIEDGVQPYDMKPGLLKGRKFVVIPFRHGTPTGENKGKNVTATGMKVMSESIYNMIKASGTVRKSSLGQRSKAFTTSNTGKRIAYTWKSGPYSGMKKSEIGRAHV